MRPPRVALVFLVAARIASAAEGQIEINALRAAAGGVTAGDDPGYPAEINAPGSYLLTSDLVAPDVLTTLIVVDASHVTIDLGGYALVGPVGCISSPANCDPIGTAVGIEFPSGRNLAVRNGRIRGIGHRGFDGTNARAMRLENVVFDGNGVFGAEVGTASLVHRCEFRRNGGFGLFSFGVAGVVSEVVSAANGALGAALTTATVLVASDIRGNGNFGVNLRNGGLVIDSTISRNAANGLELFVTDDGAGYAFNTIECNEGGDPNPVHPALSSLLAGSNLIVTSANPPGACPP